jgi:hypothetical protein
MRRIAPTLALLAIATGLAACSNEADVASQNLSQSADNFGVNRRIVFVNGITDKYLLSIEGLCSIAPGSAAKSVAVTCKTGQGQYKKHLLGLSDNVTYFAEQLEDAKVSVYHYKVTFNPATIVPSIDVR